MAERASSRSITPAVRYVGLPTRVRTMLVLLTHNFWAHSRSRKRPAILEDVGVNNLEYLKIIYLTLRVTAGLPTHKDGLPSGRL
jgi:hypothetical protein